jgi:hypothetical protein
MRVAHEALFNESFSTRGDVDRSILIRQRIYSHKATNDGPRSILPISNDILVLFE